MDNTDLMASESRTDMSVEGIKRAFLDSLFFMRAKFPGVATTNDHYLALAYAILSMLGVASIALFLSTVVRSPLAAALGALGLLVASTLLLTLDAADVLKPWLPTRYWLAFVDLFRDPIHWRDVVRGSLLQLGYLVVFLGAAWANFVTKDITD